MATLYCGLFNIMAIYVNQVLSTKGIIYDDKRFHKPYFIFAYDILQRSLENIY